MDLSPHLSDIAGVLGWKDMKDVAMRSNITNVTIDSCKQNHPSDSQEQTLELLTIWVEAQGRKASHNLIEILTKNGKKGKAESVTDILSR